MSASPPWPLPMPAMRFDNIECRDRGRREELGKAFGLKIGNITQRKGFKLYDTKQLLAS